MDLNKTFKREVLVLALVLPFLVYFIFVYSAEENFFVKLDFVGQTDTLSDGTMSHYTIPDFAYTTQDDTVFTRDDLNEKITLVNFFFTTCPSICPAMNYNVQQVQERFKGYEDFQIVSFSVDPEYDSVPVLKAYEKQIGAIPGRWYFLTGDKSKIYKTAETFFLSAMEDSLADGGFLHSENLVLLDWEGRIRSGKDEDGNLKGVYNSLSTDEVNKLKDDIKVLIAEFEKEKSDLRTQM